MTDIEKRALRRVMALAERQLDQDRRSLSGPSITLDMVAEVEIDDASINMLRAYLGDAPVEITETDNV